MKRFSAISLLFVLGGCALHRTVQRIAVDYNATIADTVNEVTLLNVTRAVEGLPRHYTAFTRLSGNVTIKASGSFVGAIKQAAPTVTSSIASGVATATGLSRATGGDTFSPTLGGEIDNNPSFDVNVLESQQFYQGILSPIPFDTIDNFISQGWDPQLLFGLLGGRIEFQLKERVNGIDQPVGATVLAFQAGDPRFEHIVRCYNLAGISAASTPIAPIARVSHDAAGSVQALKLSDLAVLDGTKFDVDGPISVDASKDASVNIVRVPSDKRAIKLSVKDSCVQAEAAAIASGVLVRANGVAVPKSPPAQEDYVGQGKVMISTDDHKDSRVADTKMSVVFRSTEGVIQRLGECLKADRGQGEKVCKVDDQVVFAIRVGHSPSTAVVHARPLETEYYLDRTDPYFPSTMRTLALLEQLVFLQQAATVSPATVPVQVISGN